MRATAVVLLGFAVILGVTPAGAQEKYTMGMAGAT
jgi:hypothetical protein